MSKTSAVKTGLEIHEAQKLILDCCSQLTLESVGFEAAQGRVLGEAVFSDRTLPPADNSAMDGFALQAADAARACAAQPVVLPLAFEVAAGAHAPRALHAGEAARIFTGAPIPPGADCVLRQEDADWDAKTVRIRVAPALGDHIRRAGEDVRQGDRLLEPGCVLGAGQIGLLTSVGVTSVRVVRRPRVAILSSGDELVEPGEDVSGGKIVSSNSYSLAALCRELGVEVDYLGIAKDDPQDVERRVKRGLAADVLVTSAGVSVGDRDYVRDVLEALGCELLFWGVKIKPGYPVVFGRFANGGPLVFGLPGNPVSAMVTFEEFVRPALRKMLGHFSVYRPVIQARLAHAIEIKPGRLHFVRVRLERVGGEVFATSTGTQSSGVLSSMAHAHGLLIIPADSADVSQGALMNVQVLDPEFFASATSGV